METHAHRARGNWGCSYVFGVGATALAVITTGCTAAAIQPDPSGQPDNGGAAFVAQPPDFQASPNISVSCDPIGGGQASLTVNGRHRTFEVALPNDTSDMALMFEWHGWNQAASAFANTIVYDVPSGNWVAFDPNAFYKPLMIVAPDDLGLFVIDLPGAVGLDWDIEPQKPSVDFPFFEAMLQCIEGQFNIDKTRLYSFGFSAGAVFTDLLSVKYPHIFAANISESGAWFNDKHEQWDVLFNNIFDWPIHWDWPAFNPADGGNVLLTHGGPNDFATVISLEDANQQALPYLANNGRTVMECAHNFGHCPDPDLTQHMYYEYMWGNQLGGGSVQGPIPDWPTQANPVGETSCYFHPAN
jgi:hypothetical protein